MSQIDTAPSEALDPFLKQWFGIEDDELRSNPSCGYHHVIIGRPRRGLAAQMAALFGLALHARMGVAYRVAAATNLVKHLAHQSPVWKVFRPPP